MEQIRNIHPFYWLLSSLSWEKILFVKSGEIVKNPDKFVLDVGLGSCSYFTNNSTRLRRGEGRHFSQIKKYLNYCKMDFILWHNFQITYTLSLIQGNNLLNTHFAYVPNIITQWDILHGTLKTRLWNSETYHLNLQ